MVMAGRGEKVTGDNLIILPAGYKRMISSKEIMRFLFLSACYISDNMQLFILVWAFRKCHSVLRTRQRQTKKTK